MDKLNFLILKRTDVVSGNGSDVEVEELYCGDDALLANNLFNQQILLDFAENGKLCEVELWKIFLDSQDNEVERELDRSDFKNSALLPENAIIVTFNHKRYMNYAYQIEEVRTPFVGERYANLHPNNDKVGSSWDLVLANFDEFLTAYNNANMPPFNKIHSGRNIYEVE